MALGWSTASHQVEIGGLADDDVRLADISQIWATVLAAREEE
jgi:hypothetical protein